MHGPAGFGREFCAERFGKVNCADVGQVSWAPGDEPVKRVLDPGGPCRRTQLASASSASILWTHVVMRTRRGSALLGIPITSATLTPVHAFHQRFEYRQSSRVTPSRFQTYAVWGRQRSLRRRRGVCSPLLHS
jgi:hypothetical protein